MKNRTRIQKVDEEILTSGREIRLTTTLMKWRNIKSERGKKGDVSRYANLPKNLWHVPDTRINASRYVHLPNFGHLPNLRSRWVLDFARL